MRERKWLVLLVAAFVIFSTGCTLFNSGDDGTRKRAIRLSAYASSEETNTDYDVAEYVLDGNPETKWHTDWSGENIGELPEWITIVVSEPVYVDQLRYLPRQDFDWDGSHQWNGTITEYEIQYSLDGDTFETIVEGEWEWDLDSDAPEAKDWKEVNFDPVEAKEIRLVAHSSTNGDASAAEIEISYTRIEEEIPETEE